MTKCKLIVDPRIPRTSRGTPAFSTRASLRLEYFAIPLSESWCRYAIASIHFIPLRSFPLDVGKVLAGIQVPPSDNEAFETFLKRLGYGYLEETENTIYRQFLRR